MTVNGVDAFNQGYAVKLQNRGKKSSGITFELKNIFAEMQKEGKLKDLDGKGLTKKDALNLYAELNKIHEQTNRATNYTKMQAGQEFKYTADEMQAMAKAAGYEIIGTAQETPQVDEQQELQAPQDAQEEVDELTPVPDETEHENNDEPEMDAEATKQETINNVIDHGGKVLKRNVDGLKKQEIAIYTLPESKVKVRRTFNENGELGAQLVKTNKLGNKRYITLQDDERSNELGNMQLKKVKIDGNKEKEFIVAGKTTDEIGETKYYRFIPKLGHPDSDGKNNRLGEEVFKVNGKYVSVKPDATQETEKPKKQNFFSRIFKSKKSKETTQQPETENAEKPKKKGFFKRLFGKKDKTQQAKTQTPLAEYDYNKAYTAAPKTIAQTMQTEMPTDEAMEKIFGIDKKKVDKMLKEIGKYSQKHDISAPEGKQEVYKIAEKYGVDSGKVQAFLDSLT